MCLSYEGFNAPYFPLLVGIIIGSSFTRKRRAEERKEQLERFREYFGNLLRGSFGFWAIECEEYIPDKHSKPNV